MIRSEIWRLPVDMVAYPIVYRVSYMSGGDRRISEPSTLCLLLKFLPCMCHTIETTTIKYMPVESSRFFQSMCKSPADR